MKLRTIQTTILTSCLCACMIAFTGCSERTGDQPGTSAGDSSLESTGEYSSESSETSSDDTPPESSNESQTSSSWEYSYPYKDIRLDHKYLETVEEDVLDVNVYLYMDEEAIREEYNEIYPNIGDNPWHWSRFLGERGEQLIKEFVRDYGIAYEDLDGTLGLTGSLACKFDKDTLSSMLDDLRVDHITYKFGGRPIMSEDV